MLHTLGQHFQKTSVLYERIKLCFSSFTVVKAFQNDSFGEKLDFYRPLYFLFSEFGGRRQARPQNVEKTPKKGGKNPVLV